MYERCGMRTCANVVKCGVVGWVKKNTLEMFRSSLKKEEYVSEIEGFKRGRPSVRWKDRVKECMHEMC